MNDILECKVKLGKVMWPKDGLKSGEYGIVTFYPIEVVNGDSPKLSRWGTFSAKGNMPEMDDGETYRFIGEQKEDDKYGSYYKVVRVWTDFDLSDKSIQKVFLSHIITEHQISELYATLQDPFEDIRNENIENLIKVKGITEDKARKIIQKYNDNIDYSAVLVKLDGYGLTQNMIDKLIKYYGSPDTVVQKVMTDPFEFANRIEGIGWEKAISIAEKAGVARDSDVALSEYTKYYLTQQGEMGNTWVYPNDFLQSVETMIGADVDQEQLGRILNELYDKGTLYWNEGKDFIAKKDYYQLENDIKNELLRILNAENVFEYENFEFKIKQLEEQQGWEFTEEQKQAIKLVLNKNVCVITGGAGCVDADTEYFNGHEWKKISEYKIGEKVLQYNDNGSAELVKPNAYIKQPKDYLWHFQTKYGLDQCLSENHEVYYITSKNNLYHKSFKDVMENQIKTGFCGQFITTFNYNGEGINLSDNDIRIMCAVIADGTFNYQIKPTAPTYNKCRIHIKKDRKKNRLKTLLIKGKYQWKEKNSTNEGYSDFYFYPPVRAKSFNDWWYKCNTHQLKIICDEVLNWDGCTKNNRKSFSTTQKNDADFIQWSFSNCGYRATITINDRVGQKHKGEKYIRKSIEYTVHISKRILIGLNRDKRPNHTKTQFEKYKTKDGYEYCFNVPSHKLILRRNNKIFITGNCGKTTITNAILEILKKYSVAQTSLSGKAAARMAEVTNKEAFTIHRLLGWTPNGFVFDKDNPLHTNIVVLDETSMVGADLFYNLVQAIPTGSKFIMLGDIGQLEAIGLANIFQDIIDSNIIPVAKLTQIHRQAQKSAIITNSHDVRNGKQITKRGWNGVEIRGELKDLTINIYKDKILTAPSIIDTFKEEYKHVNNISEIQIILPVKERGDACTYQLNNQIQEYYNPASKQKKEVTVYNKRNDEQFNYVLRVGDKVINVKNNYKTKDTHEREMPIFNGYVGVLESIEKRGLVVNFDLCGEIVIPYNSLKNIELAYAITCHKSQGSQYHTVIIGLDYSGFSLLSKEWVYTALTRAEKKCILCAEEPALRYAISHSNVTKKQTFLKGLLQT